MREGRFLSEVLGEFRWDKDADAWAAHYRDGEQRIRVVVDGADRPDPSALMRAEEVFSNWPEYRLRIASFLASEADSYRHSGLYDEVMGLEVDEVGFPLPRGDAGYIAVWFKAPTDVRQWHMEFDDKRLRHFGFQWG